MHNLFLIAGPPSSVSSATMDILKQHGCSLSLPIPVWGEVRLNNEVPAVWEVSRRAHTAKYGLDHKEKDFALYGQVLLSKHDKPCSYEDRLIAKGVEILAACGPLQALKLPLAVLVWDFWKQVFSRVASLPQVSVGTLIRQPHEVAVSWVRRFGDTSTPLETVYSILEAYYACQWQMIDERKVDVVPLRVERDRYAADLAVLLGRAGVEFDSARFESVFEERPTLGVGERQNYPVFDLYDKLLQL